jgi:LmbE family N-acetylglucosaminyl deacetylase
MNARTRNFPQSAQTKAHSASRILNHSILVLVILVSLIPGHVSAQTVPVEAAQPVVRQLSLEGVQRVLVVAPHPDDETIAPGGLIQAALANGTQMKVVVVTNGDGQFGAPVLFGMEGPLSAKGYVAMGERRQAESQAALIRLGVAEQDMYFLGYPDRGIEPMLVKNWEEASPYTAPFTRATASPYPHTYHPQAIYCGKSLLNDLTNIIEEYQPDLIVVSHPADTHTDHSALSRFTTLAVASVYARNGAYQPQIWAYLVHYGEYPNKVTADQARQFIPPASLTSGGNAWGSLLLTSAQRSTKSAAIQSYPTQMILLGSFLPEFVRSNEIYMSLSLAR